MTCQMSLLIGKEATYDAWSAHQFIAFPLGDVYSNRSQRGNEASLFGSITIRADPKRNLPYVINNLSSA